MIKQPIFYKKKVLFIIILFVLLFFYQIFTLNKIDMKKIILIATGIMLLAACKKDSCPETSDTSNVTDLTLKKYADMTSNALLSYSQKGTENQTTSLLTTNANQETRPYINSGSGTVSYIPNGCGTGTLQVKAVGTGHSTALGMFTQKTTFCINSSTQEVIGSITGEVKAANGDSLFYTFVGAGIDQPTGLIYQNYVFSGGTGRFTNASGNVTLLYQVNTPTIYSYTGKGNITY